MTELESMKKTDLKDYAETLGLEIGTRDSVENIISKINAHNGVTPTVSSEQLEKELDKQGEDGDRELTVIFNPDADGNTTNVFFGINGTCMSLPRNEEVKVKKKYLDMLTNECYGYKVQQSQDKQTGQMVTKKIKQPTYTFQIVG